MSELAVGAIRLPANRTARIGEKIARQAFFKVLGSIKVGSLTLHEGQDTQHFGRQGVPGSLRLTCIYTIRRYMDKC